jgi:hypothetical protein
LDNFGVGYHLAVAMVFRGFEAGLADEAPTRALQNDGRALQAGTLQDHFATDHEKHAFGLVTGLEQAGPFRWFNLLARSNQALRQQFVKFFKVIGKHG